MDDDGNFYFMEMNTRIQVEHPVTEMVTGIDLVAQQIRVASGEKLTSGARRARSRPRHRVPHQRRGPVRNFAPWPGPHHRLPPAGGRGVRVDSDVYGGYTVPPYYDSLIAKLIVHGRDREEAIARMRRALDEFIVEGIKTTIPFHKQAPPRTRASSPATSTRSSSRRFKMD